MRCWPCRRPSTICRCCTSSALPGRTMPSLFRSKAWTAARFPCWPYKSDERRTSMIDHTGLAVTDYEKSKQFYSRALAPLGYRMMMELPREITRGIGVCGFGVPPKPDFWLHEHESANKPPIHVAFRADSRALVDAFYKAALAAGGRDNGPPGPRPRYHPNYYGAFVLDPDGHNIEAVCHDPAG